MKPDPSFPDTKELEARMRPGKLSQGGFLGINEKLNEVLSRDREILSALGLTYKELADQLERFIQAGVSARGRPTHVDNRFEVQVTMYNGFQLCPWTPNPHGGQCMAGGGVRYASLDWNIRNLKTQQQMRGPGMIVHLIKDHHFFEGPASPYRVDPRDLARLLEIF
jgi:hypothetical protein